MVEALQILKQKCFVISRNFSQKTRTLFLWDECPFFLCARLFIFYSAVYPQFRVFEFQNLSPKLADSGDPILKMPATKEKQSEKIGPQEI